MFPWLSGSENKWLIHCPMFPPLHHWQYLLPILLKSFPKGLRFLRSPEYNNNTHLQREASDG